jgi:hypothetical protein
MFEYHGWITLRSTAEAVEDEPPLRLAEIQQLVNEFAGHGLTDLRPINGDLQLHVGGHRNHRGSQDTDVIELFAKVGSIAPGSYGILYVHDDEDPEHDLEFRIFRLVRGIVTDHADHLLSPVIPTVEDEFTG